MHFPAAVVFIFLVIPSIIYAVKESNVCTDYFSYFFSNSNKNCYYSPDLYNEVPELSLRYTYVSETHYVQTEDGYNLTIFRIPRKNPKDVILLHHPLTADSNYWVSQENMSLAFHLWYQNYDVWLSNNRGTHYSKEHLYLKPTDPKFWDFSFHEIGWYDLKAVVDYILEKTNKPQLILVGHSMGATSFLVYASLRTEEANIKIKLMILVAPIVYSKSASNHVKNVIRLEPVFRRILQSFSIHSLFGENDQLMNFVKSVVMKTRFKKFFDYAFFISHGIAEKDYMEPKYVTNIISQVPSEYAVKCTYHYAQLIRAQDRFQMYDHGYRGNLQVYGSQKPPIYPLENVMIPYFIIYSTQDNYCSPQDINLLVENLPNAENFGVHQLSKMTHMSYFYHKNTKSQLYPLIDRALNMARQNQSCSKIKKFY